MDHDRLRHLVLDDRAAAATEPGQVRVDEPRGVVVAADHVFERVVRCHDGITVSEMMEKVIADLDEPDHGARVQAVEKVMSWHLSDPSAPVALLPPDTLVHAPSLFAEAVFTHRLGAGEQADGEMYVHADLAAFQRSHGACVGDEQLYVEDRDDGAVVWTGPYGWLDAYPLDALLAVRVSSGAGAGFRVTVEVLGTEPPESPNVVSLLRARDEIT